MTEVIELLSSSSPPRPPSTKLSPGPSVTRTRIPEYRDFDVNDFGETGSLDFSVERPTKRVRLSSSPILKKGSAASNTPELDFNFSSDNDLVSDHKRRPLKKSPRRSRSPRLNGSLQVVDDITFSSSAPEVLESATKKLPRRVAAGKSFVDTLFGNDDLLDDLPISQSQPELPEYDHRTANLLASLVSDGPPKSRSKGNKPTSTRHLGTSGTVAVMDDIEVSSPAKAKPSKSSKLTEAEKAARAVERATNRAITKADKEAIKQADKVRKQVEKTVKEKEKQIATDLAEVNKSRTNKKDATPEMILDVSSLLRGTNIGNQLETRMDNVQVEVNYIDEEINLTDDGKDQGQYGSVVTWRRKVKSAYSDDTDQWEPTRPSIEKEKHVLIHLPASDFAAVAAVPRSGASILRTDDEMKANLDTHVFSIRRRFGDCIPIYLIEGLRSWLKKNLNAKNRAYTAAVRAEMDPEPPASQPRPRKRKKQSSDSLDLSHITSDIVDDLLLHLQLAHQPLLIYHTTTPADSASQISALTQHLSTRPYRLAQMDYNLKSASFCMDSGQVKTGDNAEDTFVKMLQEVSRVTLSMALGIVDQHKTVRKLVKGFDKHGNLLLEDVHKAVNADGAWSDKKLGPRVSKRLFKVFMGRDPTATDGMS